MDEVDQLFRRLRSGPYSAMGVDPNAVPYETQNPGIFPQGFLDDFEAPQIGLVTGKAYNAFFGAPPTDPDTNIDNSTNPLPSWQVFQSSGTAVTFDWDADQTNAGSGGVLLAELAAGAAGDAGYVEAFLPIPADRYRAFNHVVYVNLYCPNSIIGTAGSARINAKASYVKYDKTTTTGTEATGTKTLTAVNAATGNLSRVQLNANAGITMPSDAAWLRVRVYLERDVAATSAAGAIQIVGVRLQEGATETIVADTGTTYGYGMMYQQAGTLRIDPSAQVTSNVPYLTLEANSKNATLSAGAAAGNAALISPAGDIVVQADAGEVIVNAGLRTGWQTVSFSARQDNLNFESSERDWMCLLDNTAGASRSITGISIGQAGGSIRLLVNYGSDNIVLSHEDANSTSTNRFRCPGLVDFTLHPADSVWIVYVSGLNRWHVVGF